MTIKDNMLKNKHLLHKINVFGIVNLQTYWEVYIYSYECKYDFYWKNIYDIGIMVRVFANNTKDSKNGTWCLLV